MTEGVVQQADIVLRSCVNRLVLIQQSLRDTNLGLKSYFETNPDLLVIAAPKCQEMCVRVKQ